MKISEKAKKILAVLLAFATITGCTTAVETEEEPVEDKQEETLVENVELPEFNVIRGTFRYAGMFNEEEDASAEYAYSDEYFEIDSTVYNPSLATMSLCLELSTWSSHNTEIWEEKSQNAKYLFEKIGFEDFAQNEFWNEKPSTKSVGAVAANKKLEDSTLVAVAIRGGGYYNEWGSNVNVGLSGQHTGFAEGKQNVLNFLENYIKETGISGKIKLWIVGYSRSAAIANLTAGYINENGLSSEVELDLSDLYCYAFAPPKGAMESEIGENSDHANIHNIINVNDLVPLVAPGNWDFNRYNTTARLLPTVTTANFEEAFETMLQEYDEVLAGTTMEDPTVAEYGISEYAKKVEVTINPNNFLPSGEPLVEIKIVDDTRQTMAEMLGEFITSFADHVHGRDVYYNILEHDMISLLNDLMGYESEMDFEVVINSFVDTLIESPYDELKYVIEPVFHRLDMTKEERTDAIVDHLYEVVPQPEGYENVFKTAASFLEIIGEIIEEDSEKLVDMLLAFTDTKLMQAHYPEIMLAWMCAGDPNYTENPFSMKVPESLRVVTINCPVDVEVYDSKGVLVASAKDKVCTVNNGVVGCAVNGDGEIILHLPSDEEYKINIIATGDGEVNVNLGEYNMLHSAVTRVQTYPEIPVKTGDTLVFKAPIVSENEFTDEEQMGSSAEYELFGTDGEKVAPETEKRGNEIESFSVSVGKNNDFGYVTGGGNYVPGNFAKVTAYPISGSEFEGWFVNGELVSSDEEFRFEVSEDTYIEARFTETELYDIKFAVSGKGTVLNVNNSYSKGSEVQLSAIPKEGYVFVGWKATSGKIIGAENPEATFVVGESSATVTAVFKENKKAEVCPECGKELQEGRNHKAGCGIADHFTCDGKDHSSCNNNNNAPVVPSNPGSSSGSSSDSSSDTSSGGGASVPEVSVTYCGNCGRELGEGESHDAPCGMPKHYTCDGNDHSYCGSSSEGDSSGSDSSEEVFYPEIVCKVCGQSYPSNESHICP